LKIVKFSPFTFVQERTIALIKIIFFTLFQYPNKRKIISKIVLFLLQELENAIDPQEDGLIIIWFNSVWTGSVRVTKLLLSGENCPSIKYKPRGHGCFRFTYSLKYKSDWFIEENILSIHLQTSNSPKVSLASLWWLAFEMRALTSPLRHIIMLHICLQRTSCPFGLKKIHTRSKYPNYNEIPTR